MVLTLGRYQLVLLEVRPLTGGSVPVTGRSPATPTGRRRSPSPQAMEQRLEAARHQARMLGPGPWDR